MFVHYFRLRFISNSAQVKLPRPNLILDPRACDPNSFRFDCKYHSDGVTVTLTLQVVDECNRDLYLLKMRIYDPAIETVPDFNSTIYTYFGRTGERAPADTTVAIIDPTVKTIWKEAFMGCTKMTKCIIHDRVKWILDEAFAYCLSLEALFLPSSIKFIAKEAFSRCENIRILAIPANIDISLLGFEMICYCVTFFDITQIPYYEYDGYFLLNNNQVHQALLDFYRNMPPLHTACLNVNASVQTIHECISTHGTQAASIIDHDGMTPLHILSLNPHATVGSIQDEGE